MNTNVIYTPGVYVDEVSVLPPSVAAVSTAIPAFIGYTKSGPTNTPIRITSMVEYRDHFEGAYTPAYKITGSAGSYTLGYTTTTAPERNEFLLYYTLQMYFQNGGGPCYIVAAGHYGNTGVVKTELETALAELAKVDEPTLLCFPDATAITTSSDYYTLMGTALTQCHDLGDRFTLIDTLDTETGLRDDLPTNYLSYGAAYYPNLATVLSYEYLESTTIIGTGTTTLADLKTSDNAAYNLIRAFLNNQRVELPASGLMAGVYARTDRDRGVWKAPANVALNGVSAPTVAINDEYNGRLNIDASSGKSINAIRKFSGKGTLVWGARTLDGNSSEWKYIPVRRFFLMVEESVKKATERYVFEPNNAGTWVKVKTMISNFLTNQWKAGALMGNKAEDAFFVKVGLGQTMTQQDVLDGKMIVEIGMAAVRPAEFIILRFSHKMVS